MPASPVIQLQMVSRVGNYAKLYTVGVRAPLYMKATGKSKPIYLFDAYLVKFS